MWPCAAARTARGMSVAGRAEAANQAGAELFSASTPIFDETGTATGFECFPQTQASETHEQSLRFARLLATQMQQAGPLCAARPACAMPL